MEFVYCIDVLEDSYAFVLLSRAHSIRRTV